MKKSIIFLIFILMSALLISNTLIDVYHHDYGFINRTVLVFDSKTQYNIIENRSDIQININDCRKAEKIQGFQYKDSKVLENAKIITNSDNIMVILSTDSSYYLDHFNFTRDKFKLVLDIFKINNPKTYDEHKSFAEFYKTVGNQKLAEHHLNILKKMDKQETLKKPVEKINKPIPKKEEEKIVKEQPKKEQPEIEKTSEKPEIEKPEKKDKKKSEISKSGKDKITDPTAIEDEKNSFSILLLIIIIVVVCAVVIYLVINKLRKEEHSAEEISFSSNTGFGSKDFRKKMVSKLTEKGWEIQEIARELNLSEEEVRSILDEIG
ncbi:MAG: hypothetical protein H8E57_06495 [Candidatus Cloacimonetes bacterium]|nr:hypothetical protein [Candidatus Cloacimonadota bacterium]